MELDRLIVVLAVFGGGFLLLRPLVQAFAERLRHRDAPAVSGVGEEILEELQAMRQDMAELAERVDFTERLLAKQREAARLVPPEGR
jgi:hypothetical protein